MSWDEYIRSLMVGDFMKDAAIVGYQPGQESVWASHPGGDFSRITPGEIKRLVVQDRGDLLSNGLTLASTRCTVLRDKLNEDGNFTMDLRTKASDQQPDTFNISVGRSKQALVIVKGNKDAHGGTLNPKAYNTADYLRKSGY